MHRKQWNKTKGKKLSCARFSLFLLRTAVSLKNWQGGNQSLSFLVPLAFSNTLLTLSQQVFLWSHFQPLAQELLVSPFQIKLRVSNGTALPVLPRFAYFLLSPE